MTEKCVMEGCQLQLEGHCPEHHKEVERRRNTDKVVEEMRATVVHFRAHLEHMRKQSKQQQRMLWVNAGSLFLIISGLGLCFGILAYVDTNSKERFTEGMRVGEQIQQELSEIDQQSINRDHLIIGMQETDRTMQTELVKATTQVTAELKAITKQLEDMRRGKN